MKTIIIMPIIYIYMYVNINNSFVCMFEISGKLLLYKYTYNRRTIHIYECIMKPAPGEQDLSLACRYL